MDLASYLASLPRLKLDALYESPWTCRAVLRSLPPLAKQYVLRMLLLDGALPERARPMQFATQTAVSILPSRIIPCRIPFGAWCTAHLLVFLGSRLFSCVFAAPESCTCGKPTCSLLLQSEADLSITCGNENSALHTRPYHGLSYKYRR